ncbi:MULTISPECIES: MraY family glycosyltransferase [Micrococcaceae]|uniref:MraY family glycosyltransferase n=1 Tax=Micrococcaceae TaxID=1268 RepID=UPI00161684F9|nr:MULTISPECIES: MraY family glycosyltransferase [Micrococcaceae]MBB5748364.1 UDP-GlcNAc:undecaprenyl-phosphate GlcNAc-1-phosphate transferase [Micrococcus sp. TA1]HRO29521.1 MraY family glycosyltransferase [Citricoccus sp.]HRO93525.1 MraY family glycosyltransferase [Citricoccus sp.]
MRAYLLLLVLSALVSFVLTPAVRVLALKGRVYTPRRQRDVHRRPVPKLGGVAMFAGVLAGLGIGAMVPFLDGIFTDPDPVRGVLLALAVVLVMGVADDLWDLHWTLKLTGQVGAAALVALHGIRVEAMPVGWIPVGSEPVQIGLTIFILVLTMNAINFVDGLDGLAAGIAVIGGSAFFIYSYLLTRTINQFDYSNLATLLMALLVGCCLGFLPHNFNPARIFMGEVGAMLIGLLLATAAVAVTADFEAMEGFRFRNVPAYMPILLPIAVVALPLIDLSLAVVRRTARGSSPFSADRGHLHHKLVDGGYTHRQAVLLLYLWAFLIAYGVVSLNFLDWRIVLPVLAVLLIGAGYLTLHPWVRRSRRGSR